MEFAVKGDLFVPDYNLTPTIEVISDARGTYTQVSWVQRAFARGEIGSGATVDGVSYTLELGTDLESTNWASGPDVFQEIPGTGEFHINETETRTARTVNETTSPSFVRLKVELVE